MATRVTLTIPDEVMERARSQAGRESRAVEEVLAELVTHALQPMETHPQRDRMEREEAAYAALHPQLAGPYLGRYVAIHDGAVVDDDVDGDALVARMQARLGDELFLMRRVEAGLPREIRVPSFHWVADEDAR